MAGSLLAAAINVLNEAADFQNHANRIRYAAAVLENPTLASANILSYVLTNVTIAGQAGDQPGPSGTPFLDGDIDFVMASLFDQFANKFAGE